MGAGCVGVGGDVWVIGWAMVRVGGDKKSQSS